MAAIIQLLGVAAIIAGAALISPSVGLIVGGLLITVVGISMEPVRRGGDN
jgi:hypothetical protein